LGGYALSAVRDDAAEPGWGEPELACRRTTKRRRRQPVQEL